MKPSIRRFLFLFPLIAVLNVNSHLFAKRHETECEQILDFISTDSDVSKSDWIEQPRRENENYRLKAPNGKGVIIISSNDPMAVYALYRQKSSVIGNFFHDRGIKNELISVAAKFNRMSEKTDLLWKKEIRHENIVPSLVLFEKSVVRNTPTDLSLDRSVKVSTGLFLNARKVSEPKRLFSSDFDLDLQVTERVFVDVESQLSLDAGFSINLWGRPSLITSALISDLGTEKTLVISRSRSGQIFAWDIKTRKQLWVNLDFVGTDSLDLGFSFDGLNEGYPSVVVESYSNRIKRETLISGRSGYVMLNTSQP